MKVFKARVIDYIKNRECGEENKYDSPLFDLLNTSRGLGLLDRVLGILGGATNPGGKGAWAKTVWEKAWLLDDAYWQSLCLVHRSNDVLFCTIPKTKYLIWWQLADGNRLMQRTSETMAKLICRTSRLKSDDPRLKDASIGARMCQRCSLGVVENLYHLIMQCPDMVDIRYAMYEQLDLWVPNLSRKIKESPQDAFSWLIGKSMVDLSALDTVRSLEITGRHICMMYLRAIEVKEGIG